MSEAMTDERWAEHQAVLELIRDIYDFSYDPAPVRAAANELLAEVERLRDEKDKEITALKQERYRLTKELNAMKTKGCDDE